MGLLLFMVNPDFLTSLQGVTQMFKYYLISLLYKSIKILNLQCSWHCHIDDDMYVLLPPLIRLLSKFSPRTEAVYLGRSGSEWFNPRKVVQGAKLGHEGQGYHFAVGGLFCLSRAMIELAKPYIV